MQRAKESFYSYLGGTLGLTKLWSGQKIYVDTMDNSLTPYLIESGEWKTRVTKVFLNVVKDSTVIFDIGSNFGYFTLMAFNESKNKIVHAFDPNPRMVELLTRTVGLNNLDKNVVINEAGVTNKDTATLADTSRSKPTHYNKSKKTVFTLDPLYQSQSSFAKEKGLDRENEIRVVTVKLDDYCERENISKVDLIKMHIEGYEEVAFNGMQNIVNKSPNVKLLMEFNTTKYANSESFFEKLKYFFPHCYLILDRVEEIKEYTELLSYTQNLKNFNLLFTKQPYSAEIPITYPTSRLSKVFHSVSLENL